MLGFDCLYFTGDETLWPKWAEARPDVKLFVYFQGSTRSRSEKLRKQKVANISVEPSKAKGHNFVLMHHLRERLDTAPLQLRGSVQSLRSSAGDRSGIGSCQQDRRRLSLLPLRPDPMDPVLNLFHAKSISACCQNECRSASN